MLLYHQPRSRSARVLWLAEEAGAPLDVDVSRASTRHRRVPEAASAGAIPGLVGEGGALFESAALCLHLADRHPEAGLIARLWDRTNGHSTTNGASSP